MLIHRALPGVQSDLLEGWSTSGAALSDLRRWLFDGVVHAIDREYYGSRTSSARRERRKATT